MTHLKLVSRLLLPRCVVPVRLHETLILEFSFTFAIFSIVFVTLALHMRLDDVDRLLHQLMCFSLRMLQDALDLAPLPAGGSNGLRL